MLREHNDATLWCNFTSLIIPIYVPSTYFKKVKLERK